MGAPVSHPAASTRNLPHGAQIKPHLDCYHEADYEWHEQNRRYNQQTFTDRIPVSLKRMSFKERDHRRATQEKNSCGIKGPLLPEIQKFSGILHDRRQFLSAERLRLWIKERLHIYLFSAGRAGARRLMFARAISIPCCRTLGSGRKVQFRLRGNP